MPMIDLHCHYLPGVDDGARTLDEGLALIRAAVANGIDRIVLTPHVHPGRYENTSANLAPRFENFRRAVASAQIPVQLALASEARLCDELLPLLDSGKIPLLKSEIGAQTLLLEFPHSHMPAGCLAFIRWLQRRNIAPLLVHPERNKELMTHPQRLQKLREAGCMVQVTAGAIVGSFGARAQHTVNLFLEKQWVDLVASDAHNLRHRPPLMREANAIIARRYGEKIARQLCEITPYSLAAGNFAAHQNKKLVVDKNEIPIVNEAMLSAYVNTTIEIERNNLCDSAVGRMRSELLRRAAEPNTAGAKAARILQLMNALQAS